MFDFKNGFNSFLESGNRQKRVRSGYTGVLLFALVGSSAVQLVISTTVTLVSSAYPSMSVPMSLLNIFCSLVISNAAFSFFWMDSDSGSSRPSASCRWDRLLKSFPVQIVCAVLISLVQVFVSSLLVSMTLMVNVRLGMFCSVVISVMASLVTAGCVFGIIGADPSDVNGMHGVTVCGKILGRSFTNIRAGLGDIARPLCLLVIWNTLAGFAVPSIVTVFIGSSSVLSSLSIASLVGSGLFAAAGFYAVLMLIHFVVASYFEMDVLIGISTRYSNTGMKR